MNSRSYTLQATKDQKLHLQKKLLIYFSFMKIFFFLKEVETLTFHQNGNLGLGIQTAEKPHQSYPPSYMKCKKTERVHRSEKVDDCIKEKLMILR